MGISSAGNVSNFRYSVRAPLHSRGPYSRFPETWHGQISISSSSARAHGPRSAWTTSSSWVPGSVGATGGRSEDNGISSGRMSTIRVVGWSRKYFARAYWHISGPYSLNAMARIGPETSSRGSPAGTKHATFVTVSGGGGSIFEPQPASASANATRHPPRHRSRALPSAMSGTVAGVRAGRNSSGGGSIASSCLTASRRTRRPTRS